MTQKRIGKYLIEGENEDGSLLARDPVLDRVVTLVVLPADSNADDRARFQRQARAAAAIDHPNVVRVLETGEDEGRPFIAYERIEGATLADRAKNATPAKVDRWLVEIAEALQAIHESAIVHRAVNAESVRIASSGKAKLGGFSLARPENVAPDSFRTKTMSGAVDNAFADRVQWADMAIALGSPKIARIAKIARADRFETTASMVDALDDEPRPNGAPVFLIAVMATLAVGAAAAYVVSRFVKTESTHTDASAPIDASIDAPVVAIVDAAPAPIVSAAPSAAVSAAPAILPPYAIAIIPELSCIDPDDQKRVRAAYSAAAPAMVRCMRDLDEQNETVNTVRMDLIVHYEGGLSALNAQRPLSVRDRDCIELVASKAWPIDVIPKCATPAGIRVIAYRGCYCPGEVPDGRPRCASCSVPNPPKQLIP